MAGKPSQKAGSRASNPFSDYAKGFVWVKLAIYAGMAIVAYRAYRANNNSLTNPKDGTKVTVDTARVIETGIEVLGFPPSISPTLSKSAKLALDNYLRQHAIRTGRT